MASNTGGNTSRPRESPYSAEMVEELRRYNATLSSAAPARHRPGRGINGRGGSGINRGIGARISPGRPAPVANARTYGSPAMLGSHVVGSRAPVASRGAHAPVTGRQSHASPLSTSNPWSTAVLASNPQPVSNPAFASTPFTQQLPNSTTRASAPSFQAPIASSQAPTTVTGNVLGSAPSGILPMTPPPVPASASVNNQVNGQAAAVSTRKRIVTNWGPDPVGPQCPAHLQQPSASAAIAEIANLIGMPYDELTADGMTIPAPAPRTASQEQRTAKHRHTSSEMDIDEQNGMATAPAEPVPVAGNLQDSRWAEAKWDLPAKKPAPSEVISKVSFIQGGATVDNSENSRPQIAIVGLKDSVFATPSTNTPTYQSGPLQSFQNAWSAGQASAPAPTMSHAHTAHNINPLRQTSNQFPAQAPFGSRNIARPSNPFDQVSNPFGKTSAPAPGPFSFGATAKPVAPSSTTASGSASAAPKSATASNPAKTEKTLKDSMWA